MKLTEFLNGKIYSHSLLTIADKHFVDLLYIKNVALKEKIMK